MSKGREHKLNHFTRPPPCSLFLHHCFVNEINIPTVCCHICFYELFLASSGKWIDKMPGSLLVFQVIGELPEHFAFIVFYSVPIYWLANLNPLPENFLLNFVLMWLVVYCSRTMALWMSALFPTLQMSSFLSNSIFTASYLTGGFIIRLDNLWTSRFLQLEDSFVHHYKFYIMEESNCSLNTKRGLGAGKRGMCEFLYSWC